MRRLSQLEVCLNRLDLNKSRETLFNEGVKPMPFIAGHTPSRKGKASAVQPIKDPAQIAAIKALLADSPRDYALFVLGCNSAYRCGDLLNIERDDLTHLPNGCIRLDVQEAKTRKVRAVELNLLTSNALRAHLESSTGRYLFEGQRGRLTVSSVNRLMKTWAAAVGVRDRVATHSMRKTFARQHLDRGARITTLMHALNHSSERQTLGYLGIVEDDLRQLYADEI